jgi:hypothetical protein
MLEPSTDACNTKSFIQQGSQCTLQDAPHHEDLHHQQQQQEQTPNIAQPAGNGLWNALPVAVHAAILQQRLGAADLLACSSTCHAWRAVVQGSLLHLAPKSVLVRTTAPAYCASSK